jgi:hypothetical protein
MADLAPIEEYIMKRRDTISTYAANTTDIYNICKGTKASTGFSNQLIWWKNYEEEKEKDESEIVTKMT